MDHKQPSLRKMGSVLLLTLTLPLGALAAAPPSGMPPGEMMPPPPDSMDLRGAICRLELSEKQQDQMFEITHNDEPTLRQVMKTVQKQQKILDQLGRADAFDEKEATQAAKALGAANAELALLRTRQTQRLYALLTPEQREKLQQFKEQQNNRGNSPEQRGRHPLPPPANACRMDEKHWEICQFQGSTGLSSEQLRI